MKVIKIGWNSLRPINRFIQINSNDLIKYFVFNCTAIHKYFTLGLGRVIQLYNIQATPK